MKKLMLATVSALALGLAGAGVGHAAPASTNSTMPATDMSATPPAQDQGAQAAQGTQQSQGTQMEQGSQSASVAVRLSRSRLRQVQEQLRSAGLYKGRIDGRMGSGTKRAVQAFQQQNDLQATGSIDQQTLAALQNNTASGGSAVSPGAEPSAGGISGTEGNQMPAGKTPTGNNH